VSMQHVLSKLTTTKNNTIPRTEPLVVVEGVFIHTLQKTSHKRVIQRAVLTCGRVVMVGTTTLWFEPQQWTS
jgi:intracellular septation protein A